MTKAGVVVLDLEPGAHTIGAQLWGPPGTAIELSVFARLKTVADVAVDLAMLELQPGESETLTAVVLAGYGTVLTNRGVS